MMRRTSKIKMICGLATENATHLMQTAVLTPDTSNQLG